MEDEILPQMLISTAEENNANMEIVKKYWFLGPEVTSIYPTYNVPYWQQLAVIMQVDEVTARRRLCANCEYYNNSEDMQRQMEIIPLNKLDTDGGGRGYCHKFNFICHNLRTCQAWENKEYEMEK